MLNRRQFFSAAAAGAAMLARGTKAFAAAKYDLMIKGGRVVDPSVRLDAVRDVAISGGRIAAVEATITDDAADTVDARGKLVVPGLLDIHTHCGRFPTGPALVLQDGVTGWVDAGSQGADRIGETIAIARSSPQQGRVLINIGRAGILPDGDTMDLGGRTLKVIGTPGHTPDAIALLDDKNGLLFTGDSFYLGPIYLYRPETDLDAYVASMQKLGALAPHLQLLLPSHNTPVADPSYLPKVVAAIQQVRRGRSEIGGHRWEARIFVRRILVPDAVVENQRRRNRVPQRLKPAPLFDGRRHG